MTHNTIKPVAETQAHPDAIADSAPTNPVTDGPVTDDSVTDGDIAAQRGSTEQQAAPKGMTEEDANFGHALRSIYQQTVEEAIPDEMMNLLNRLG